MEGELVLVEGELVLVERRVGLVVGFLREDSCLCVYY